MQALQIVTEPHRLEILRLVWDREREAGDIASHFKLTFGAVSHHLGILRDAGYVTVTKAGNHRLYQVDREGLGSLLPVVESMWTAALDSLVRTIESDLETDGRS